MSWSKFGLSQRQGFLLMASSKEILKLRYSYDKLQWYTIEIVNWVPM